ncbi:MAG: hypothetical protein GX363_04625 [Clostridiales bacterium]|nr:hypothetical protein [Clostridiales bacterium]
MSFIFHALLTASIERYGSPFVRNYLGGGEEGFLVAGMFCSHKMFCLATKKKRRAKNDSI